LVPPAIILEELALSEMGSRLVATWRDELTRILSQQDDRLIAIVGPCSIHDPAAALDYARRLHDLGQELRADVVMVMRAYFMKPRTSVGWKGLVSDPHRDGSFRINDGLRLTRRGSRTASWASPSRAWPRSLRREAIRARTSFCAAERPARTTTQRACAVLSTRSGPRRCRLTWSSTSPTGTALGTTHASPRSRAKSQHRSRPASRESSASWRRASSWRDGRRPTPSRSSTDKASPTRASGGTRRLWC